MHITTHKPVASQAPAAAVSTAKVDTHKVPAAQVEVTPTVATSNAQLNAHRLNVTIAENTKQNAVAAAGNNQSSINAAIISYHKSIISSGLNNNIQVGVNMDALRALGQATWQ
jgi:hypothetical protein